MTDLEFEQKALKLLEILAHHSASHQDNIKYLAFVLKSWYEEGYRDAIYKVEKPYNKLL